MVAFLEDYMNTIKYFSRFIALFTIVGFFALPSWSAIDECPGNVVTGLNGATTSQSKIINATIPANSTHYYYFTPSVNGTIQVDSYMNATYNSLSIKSGCSAILWNDTSDSNSKSTNTINVTSGQQVIIAYERRYTNSKPYSLDFTFIAQTPPLMGNIPNQTGNVGASFSLNLSSYVTLTNGDAITGYTLTGTLPTGLSFNTTTGIISGTPTTVASAVTFSATATDNDGLSNSDSFTITVNPPQADLVLTITAPASVTTNNTIQYAINITNNGPLTTDNIVVTDILPTSLTYQTSYGADWICTFTSASRTLSCIHPTSLVSGDSASITIVTVAPSTAQTVTNSASITSSALSDSNSANNSASTSTTVLAASTSSSNERQFTLQKQYNINGNVQIVGNSMLLKSDGTCAGTGTNNNDISTTWANKDSDGTTWNATSADLTLPKGVNSSKIKYAGLYWQGRVDDAHDDAAFWAAAKTIKFKAQGLSYQTLTSSDSKYNWTLRSSDSNYQGSLDVTAIIKQSIDTAAAADIDSTGFSGTFWGANIQAEKMTNGFGAWALIVVYEDYADTLKNISLYDGYTSVDNGEVIPTTLSGFLTPTSGAVESNFLIFGGEGDITLTDSVTLTNRYGVDQSLGSNIFNSSQEINDISVTDRDPSCENTIGIDIDSFDVGSTSTATPIIGNNQTSTIVKLKSTGDVYYPGLFAFSTQLYTPDVCYLEDVSFNGLAITGSNLPATGDNVEYTISITNKNNEPAKGVFVEKVFDRPDEIIYVQNSMSIAPIPGISYTAKTDTIGDDTAEYSNPTETIKLLLGSEASWYEGGTITKDAITKFKYSAEIGDQNASENSYLISYRNDLLHITFTGIPIRKCSDFNNSFGVYTPVIGNYNTVRSNSGIDLASGPDPIEPADEKNALYTQIVSKPFDVHVISFANDNITPASWSGDLNLTIVEVPESGDCSDANTILSNTYELHFLNEKYKQTTVTPTAASKNALFKMVTNATTVCSRDSFSIRPAAFKIDANDTTLVGNRPYQFTFTASHDGSPVTPSQNYTQSIHNALDKNATTQLIIPLGCTLPTPIEYTNVALPFIDGQVSALVIYPNIGNVEFKLSDNQWSAVSGDQNKGDCVIGSENNTPDADGKVGCMVQSAQTFAFVPEKFTSTLTLANSNSVGGFTYIATNEPNMSAPLTLTATASLDGNMAATNYTAGCFSRNTNTTITLANNQNLSPSGTTTQNRIKFFDDLNTTSRLISQIGNQATFLTSEGNFTNGSSVVTIRANFDRNQTNPDNPFNIARNDFNITQIVDTDGVTGSDFNRTNDMNATFVYGRTNASRQRYIGNSGATNIYFESFCFGATCNTALLPNGAASRKINDARWYINDNHVSTTDGNITVVVQKGGVNAGTDTVTATDNPVGNPSQTTLDYSGGRGYPYKTTMQNGASPWLIYNESNQTATRNEFQVEFNDVGEWSGEHNTTTTTKKDKINTSTNRRVIW